MPQNPSLRAQLAGQKVYGTWCIVPSPELLHVLSTSKLDFLLVDQEHGVCDLPLLQRCVFAAHAGGCPVLVRLQDGSPIGIARALDTGVDGILIPHIEGAEQVHQLIQSACYPPSGSRGFSPFTPAFHYTPGADVTRQQNERVAIGALVESKAGIEAMPSICGVPRLDFVYLGAYDLSVELGKPGELDSPELLALLEEAVAVARAHGKPVAAIFHDRAQHDMLMRLGVSMPVYSVDTAVIRRAYDTVANWR
jgi:4-hydroxy-2-oxoheptanedioate aldolase